MCEPREKMCNPVHNMYMYIHIECDVMLPWDLIIGFPAISLDSDCRAQVLDTMQTRPYFVYRKGVATPD